MNDLNLQVFWLPWNAFTTCTPQNVGIMCSSPHESFNEIEGENSVYVYISKCQQATNIYFDIRLFLLANCNLIVLESNSDFEGLSKSL